MRGDSPENLAGKFCRYAAHPFRVSAQHNSLLAQSRNQRFLFFLAVLDGACFRMSCWHGQSYSAGTLQKTAPERISNVPSPWVQFRIDDAYVPEPAQILMELHAQDTLLGKLVDVSDSEAADGGFAVVEVKGLSQPVVVAMKHIREIRYE